MDDSRRWQDWLNLALGIWLFFSPFFMGYATGADGVAAWNSYLLGIGVVIFAAAAIARPAQWEEWINLALGVWLVISPWVLGFSADETALWNHLIVGLIIGIDAAWAMAKTPREVAR